MGMARPTYCGRRRVAITTPTCGTCQEPQRPMAISRLRKLALDGPVKTGCFSAGDPSARDRSGSASDSISPARGNARGHPGLKPGSPSRPNELLGEKGYDADWFRDAL